MRFRRKTAKIVRCGERRRRVVALTFDGGADAENAPLILETLERYGIQASFAITGRWAADHAELVVRIAAHGHHLMNHSFHHRSFTGFSTGAGPLSTPERFEQLDRADAAIGELTGSTTKPWFRPPFGDHDRSVNADLYARGYLYNVRWSVDSLGWKATTPEDIARRCLDQARPGAIYLLHVGSRSEDGRALPAIIEGLQARGYGFATVARLLT